MPFDIVTNEPHSFETQFDVLDVRYRFRASKRGYDAWSISFSDIQRRGPNYDAAGVYSLIVESGSWWEAEVKPERAFFSCNISKETQYDIFSNELQIRGMYEVEKTIDGHTVYYYLSRQPDDTDWIHGELL